MEIADPKALLTDLLNVAVVRADPMRCIPEHLPPRTPGRLVVIGAGKASARMAEAVESVYGPCEGLVITRYGYARPCKGIEIVEAAHPVPDAAALEATARMQALLGALDPGDRVIALISGGGSSLLCSPVSGVTLADKQDLNRALLASGMPISGMNLVRTQLSRVKGGRLAAAAGPTPVLSLILSDVPGDDPAEIASGPTAGSRATSKAALAMLDKWNVPLPDAVRGAIAKAPDAIPPDDPRLSHATSRIVAAPSHSLAAAREHAEARGLEVSNLGDALEGESRDLAQQHADEAQQIACDGPLSAPVLLLSGGECTVTQRGDGAGGPNAEYALAAAIALDGHPRIHVIACDTDGVDGAAEIAGAYAGPDTLRRAARAGLSAADALDANNAHSFFAGVDSQIVTGPTLTNVNDFRALLILPGGNRN